MGKIGGSITGHIFHKTSVGKNEIGESIPSWVEVCSIPGWLGLQSGDSKYTNNKAKVEESTHVFLSDFFPGVYALADQDTRMILKGIMYDVLLIDNPDEMDEQLEIYLRRVGAWDGC